MRIETILGYKFKDKSLLKQCLSHKSYANEHDIGDNERLEFLGDSVLSIVVSKHLFVKFTNYSEGKLSKIKNQIVSKKFVANCVKKYKLDRFLKLGKGEIKTNGGNRDSNLCCLYEAIVGGIFIDSGIIQSEKFIKKTLLDIDFKRFKIDDFKSDLQIYFQKNFGYPPKYKVIEEYGPAHNKTFKISVIDKDREITSAIGKTKKEAQNKAAKKILKKLSHL